MQINIYKFIKKAYEAGGYWNSADILSLWAEKWTLGHSLFRKSFPECDVPISIHWEGRQSSL